MKAILIAATAALVVMSGLYMTYDASISTGLSPSEIDTVFTAWKMQHGKTYGASAEEEYRKSIFAANYKGVQEHNSNPNKNYTQGLNQFSDLEESEFKATYLGAKQIAEGMATLKPARTYVTDSLPATLDWRQKGAVNPIKNQGQCGSCWAFGTIATTEAAAYADTKTLRSFSEQQLVDCDRASIDNGCGGGLPYYAMQYIRSHGIALESAYGYTARDGYCRYTSSMKAYSLSKGGERITSNNVDQMKAALTKGTIAVLVEADRSAFQRYQGGILDDYSCGTNYDHAVSLVGWGNENGTEYWILRNSWGASWGEQGYMRVKITSGAGYCGVQQNPSRAISNSE